MQFSDKLKARPEAKNADALKRIELGKIRVQSVLDKERVAHQKTLEQKISDQGPPGKRVDPHLLGLAIMDLKEQSHIKASQHEATGAQNWYSNRLAKNEEIKNRLATLAPLYKQTLSASNSIGDALEIITEKAIAESLQYNPRYSYLGHFLHDEERDKHGRVKKVQPPKSINRNKTIKEADFIILGYDEGPICVECKNYREWFYPHHDEICSTIIKAYELGCIPVFVGRRIHYTTRENMLNPAGMIFHETFYQYYDVNQAHLAAQAKDKTLLGFSDIRSADAPDNRTLAFFKDYLPKILKTSAPLWEKNRDSMYAYAHGEMNLAQLYTEIGSPAGGKWQSYEEEVPF